MFMTDRKESTLSAFRRPLISIHETTNSALADTGSVAGDERMSEGILPEKRSLERFGPRGVLLGAFIDGKSSSSSIGTVMWSMGFTDVKIARRLARHGIPSMLARFEDTAEKARAYEGSPVPYCQAAMDKLAAVHNARSFLLMGNCAYADICLKTALADPRVIGLVLTNPFLGGADSDVSHRAFVRYKLLRWRNWRRLFRGRTNFRTNLRDLGHLLGLTSKPPPRSTQRSAVAPTSPANLNEILLALNSRGVRVLIACAEGDASYHRCRTIFGECLQRAACGDELRFVSLPSDQHNLAVDESAGDMLYEAVSGWIDEDFLRIAPGRRAERQSAQA